MKSLGRESLGFMSVESRRDRSRSEWFPHSISVSSSTGGTNSIVSQGAMSSVEAGEGGYSILLQRASFSCSEEFQVFNSSDIDSDFNFSSTNVSSDCIVASVLACSGSASCLVSERTEVLFANNA